MEDRENRVWFITGCSTGFGRLLAEEVLKRGERVIATARDEGKVIDFADRYPDTIAASVQDAIDSFGQIDVLVNNAGYGLTGAVEEASDEEIEQVISTNVLGTVDTTRAILPHMRERRSGHILNLSSAAGLVGTQGLAYYNLTKFAVEGFSEALAMETKPLGIKVTLIEPGPFRTDFLGRSGQVAKHKMREYFETQAGKQAGDPQKAVEAMIAVVNAPEPPMRLVLGRNAYDRYRNKLEAEQNSLALWSETTLGADFSDGA